MSSVHRRHAGPAQRLGGDQRHLGIGRGGGAADQLDAGLGKLAFRGELGAAHPQHLAGIAEPQRAGCRAEPGGGDAGDLRGGVGAQAHHALADRVHQPEGLLGHGGAGAGEQAVLEFQQRRLERS